MKPARKLLSGRRCCWWAAKSSLSWKSGSWRSWPPRQRADFRMPLREDLLEPIPGDNPCGANLYYSPLFDKIKEARRQESAGPMGAWEREVKTADYLLVIKLCEEALATQTKDLWLGVWLTEGLIARDKFEGLRDGISFLGGLTENFGGPR